MNVISSAIKALVVFARHLHFSIDQSFTSIWLFTHFEEQLRRVISLAILVTLPWLENSNPYLESAANPFYHSFLKRQVFFKLFSSDS